MKRRNIEDLNQKALEILQDNQLQHKYTQLRKGARLFLNTCIRVNQTGVAFSRDDFPNLSKDMWKQYVFGLRKAGFVQTIGKSTLAYYRVTGFRLNDFWEKVTLKSTGVSLSNNNIRNNNCENIYQIVHNSLSDMDMPSLHNIRLHFSHDYLYHHVKEHMEKNKPYDISYNDSNKFLTIYSPINWGNDISAQIILTRTKLVQIIIKNTYKPLAYTEEGIYSLIEKLGEIKEYLAYFSRNIPPVLKWMFVRADFGMDCKKPINQMFPEMEFKDIVGALVRFYAKSWENGDKRLRIETIISPNKSMEEILKETISNQYRYVNVNYPITI